MGLSCVVFGHSYDPDGKCACGADVYQVNTGYTREQLKDVGIDIRRLNF